MCPPDCARLRRTKRRQLVRLNSDLYQKKCCRNKRAIIAQQAPRPGHDRAAPKNRNGLVVTEQPREWKRAIRKLPMNGTAATRRPLLANDQHLAGAQSGGQLGIVALQSGHGGVIGFGDAAQGLAFLNLVVLGSRRTRRRRYGLACPGGFDRNATAARWRLFWAGASQRLVDGQHPSRGHLRSP